MWKLNLKLRFFLLFLVTLCQALNMQGFLRDNETFQNDKDQIHGRSVRMIGDKPDLGYCQAFKFGGTSGLHFYICCNNCEPSGLSCDTVTWHSASTTSYCGSCGADLGNGDENGVPFYCGGCSGQRDVDAVCMSQLRWVYELIGLCWGYTDCLREKCIDRYGHLYPPHLNSKGMPDTCYDLKCDSNETPDNCPADCCHQKNPGECTWNNNSCVKECCGDPSCCLSSFADGLQARALPYIFSITWVTMTSLYLIYFS